MIQRFNFYDLYGYLIPGLALVVVLWVPFGIIYRWLPTGPAGDLSWLALAVVIAYVAGYFVQSIATNGIPSGTDLTYPSVTLLNQSDATFSPELKAKIADSVRSRFNLEIDADKDADLTVARRRQNAFSLCRPIVNASSSYPEQFQGLYSMMRGLMLAMAFGMTYMYGWALSVQRASCVLAIGGTILVISLVGIVLCALLRFLQPLRSKWKYATDAAALILTGLFLMGAGYRLGLHVTPNKIPAGLFVVIALVYLAGALRFYVSYRSFSRDFARTVWEHFAAQPATGAS